MGTTLERHLARVGRLWQRLDQPRTHHPEGGRAALSHHQRAQASIDRTDEVAGTLSWLRRQGLTENQIRIVLAVSALDGERDFNVVARQLGISRQGVRDAYLRAWRRLSIVQARRDGLLE